MFIEVYSRQLIDHANLARVGVISGTRHVDQCVSLAFKMFNENNWQFLTTQCVNKRNFFHLIRNEISNIPDVNIFHSFFSQKVFTYMTLLWLTQSNPSVIPAFSVLGSDLFFLVGKEEMTPRLQLYYLLELIHHLKGGAEMRHFPRSHARLTTFEMQMSDKLNELWDGMNNSSLGRWHDQKKAAAWECQNCHILTIFR